jgi:tRNA dimethylallyltransferase
MAASGAPKKNSEKIQVVLISGPTCSGKSSLAIKAALKFNAEIISADSRQVFRQIKIGTDRLDPEEWQGIKHHLMGFIDLSTRFTVFDFVSQANRIIKDVAKQGKGVIICGGTGLYIRALTDGIFEIPEDDFSYRNDLTDLAARKGPSYVHNMLQKVDPQEAAQIHPNNLIKIIRALEIYHITGQTKSELMSKTKPINAKLQFLQIILMPERHQLYKAIEDRIDMMIKDGLIDEISDVYNSDFRKALIKSKIVGYSELIEYLEGKLTLEGAVNLVKQNTRRFAKRQYTWFKAIKNAEILPGTGFEAENDCYNLIETFWNKDPSD